MYGKELAIRTKEVVETGTHLAETGMPMAWLVKFLYMYLSKATVSHKYSVLKGKNMSLYWKPVCLKYS